MRLAVRRYVIQEIVVPLKNGKPPITLDFVERDKEPWRQFAARMAAARAKKEERRIEAILDWLLPPPKARGRPKGPKKPKGRGCRKKLKW